MDDETLTVAVCAHLGGIDGWAWSDSTAYPSDQVGVYYGSIPDAPDLAVGVRLYGATDDDLSTRRVQLRLRGARQDRAGADRLGAAALERMHSTPHPPGIAYIRRQSMAPYGADTNQREERTENYLIILDNKESAHA